MIFMKLNDVTWMIGGEAGFGIQSAGHIFALAAARGGLHAFGTAEYPSLIRGGHNSDAIRVADREVYVHKEQLDLLLAMNKETLDLHLKEIVAGGGVIYDSDVIKSETIKIPEGVKVFAVPLKKIAMEMGKGDITRNTVGVAASFALVDYDIEIIYDLLRHMFAKKGEQIVTNNLAAAKAGYDYIREHYAGQFEYKLQKVEGQPRRMLLTGNDAICLGALKAGCKFVAEYPMTPSSSILHFMAAHAKDYNIIVKHTEDEIAAMNMVVGAGWAGVRAMTGTSGGGFSLMVEALGMAGICEVPIVCVEVQRPGPSTGLPTRTEQCDLQFVLHASQGEFPRIVIAPGDYQENFYLTFQAFNLAEKYQTPVLILSDKHLAESVKTIELFKTDGLQIDRGKLLSQAELDELRKKSEAFLATQNGGTLQQKGFGGASAPENYLTPDNQFMRYKFTEDGVSHRTIPGMKGGIHRSATDEHDETGDLTETPENRSLMVEKRARKLAEALKELPAPKLIGPEKADLTFVTWGSPKEALLEVMEMLQKEGITANMLQIIYMSPFHSKEIGEILRACKITIGVEMNNEAQLCALISEKTGYFVHHKILKYSGRQFTAHELYDRTKEVLKNQS
jgi:2-oxoglutarate ferredoxin oxidoreductase subunit alpha